MSDRTEQRRTRVAVLHPDPAAVKAVLEQADVLVLGCVFDPKWALADVAVIHTAVAGWEAVLRQMRRRDPAMRVLAVATDLPLAIRAVNEFGIERLIADDADIARGVAELRDAPPTEAQRLEREVQTRTAVLQQIKSEWEQSFDAVQDPMAVIDASYRIIRVNRAYARHMGSTVVEVPGHTCFELRSGSSHVFEVDADGACCDCPVRTVRFSGRPSQATLQEPAGLRWMVSAYPVDIPDLPWSLVVHYRDITAEVERLAKIARADKMSAVGKLAGAVAHELNSPMTSIMVFSEALARKTEDGSELHAHAREINESALRCRRLIQGLLRFARRPRGRERASVSLALVMEEIRPLLQHRIDVARIQFAVDLPLTLWTIHGHVADVEHLLVDLLSNAIEACGPDDTVQLSARNLVGQQMVEFSVRDSGRGMTPEVLESAFDPFFSTKSGAQAAGLGLTTCEAMVADMGGTMGLDSAPGRGTVAWVRLPAAGAEGEVTLEAT